MMLSQRNTLVFCTILAFVFVAAEYDEEALVRRLKQHQHNIDMNPGLSRDYLYLPPTLSKNYLERRKELCDLILTSIESLRKNKDVQNATVLEIDAINENTLVTEIDRRLKEKDYSF